MPGGSRLDGPKDREDAQKNHYVPRPGGGQPISKRLAKGNVKKSFNQGYKTT